MAPQSRGEEVPTGLLSKSIPDLATPTLQTGQHEATSITSSSPPRSGIVTSSLSPAFHSAVSELAPAEYDQDQDAAAFTLEEFDSSDSDEEDEELSRQPSSRLLHPSHSHSHLPRHAATTLYPPFYNRPPTPLPPSPSLTSLLRPTFSSAASRPTTPDSSDIDAPRTHSTLKPQSSSTKLAASAIDAPTVPRAAPKVPTYEYYGFALYLGSSAAFLMYILWAYVPAPMLHQMGIRYYPNRWWALAVPCWLVVLIIYIYVALASYNTRYLTLPMDSVENVVDQCAQVAVVEKRTREIVGEGVGMGGKAPSQNDTAKNLERYQFSADDDVDWKTLWSTGTDAVMDVPIGGVCEILYGD